MMHHILGYEIWVTTPLRKDMYHLGNVVMLTQMNDKDLPGFLIAYDENDHIRGVPQKDVQAIELRTIYNTVHDSCYKPNIGNIPKFGDQDSGPVKLTTAEKIRDLCGYIENGNGMSLHICQDDATQWWSVSAYVGRKRVFHETDETFDGAVANAYDRHGGRD